VRPIEVFVLGLDEANLTELRAVPDHARYRFHPLLSIPELQEGEIPIVELLDKAREQLHSFDGEIGAIVGFWDFPVSSMVPMLCAEFGLPGAPLRPIVTCEHKYWSRLEQRKVIDELPRFGLVDLKADTSPPDGLRYPLWLKPIKGFSSELAFQVRDDEEFAHAVAAIGDGVQRVGEPFQYVLDQLQLPPEIAAIGPCTALAEEAISGNQVATEGYVYHGDIHVYGVLDSLNYPDSPVFLRHQYPSQLPERVRRRLVELSERVIGQIGLDNSTFSIEFFHDPDTDAITVLEINPRHSQSHAALFDLVDGVPNHHVMLCLATGRDPAPRQGAGPYRIAAKWYHRSFADGVVRRVPTDQELEQLHRDMPGVTVRPVPKQGQRLGELTAQDSYSYELADVIVGAHDVADLEDTYRRVIDRLGFKIDTDPETDTGLEQDRR
jgi:ATP-grasp domain-containing protein